jgi:hypothetical protein
MTYQMICHFTLLKLVMQISYITMQLYNLPMEIEACTIFYNNINPLLLFVTTCHRHFQEKLLGREPTAEELYVHLHVSRENGQSSVVAQAIAELTSRAELMDAIREENNDGYELPTEEEEELITDVQTFETTSLQFANSKTKEVFVSFLAICL